MANLENGRATVSSDTGKPDRAGPGNSESGANLTTASPIAPASLWTTTNRLPFQAAALQGSVEAEIVIVGGGVAGAATALHLARTGRDVVLVDAPQSDPAPATRASAGIVAGQLVRNTPAGVLRRHGQEEGGRFLRLVGGSARYTFDLIREEGLACAPANQGFLAPFAAARRAQEERNLADWAPFRNDMRILGSEETAALSGCTGYAGAVLDTSGGALDPLAYRNAMLARAAELGVRVLSAKVTHPVVSGHGRYALRCDSGTVTARRVVLAANGGNGALAPVLRRTILPLPVCEVATAPLPSDLRAAILPHGHALTDLQTDIFTIRFDADGRLITALPMPDVFDPAAIEQAVNRRLHAMIPAWRTTPLEHVWSGTAWLNSNLLPRLVRCDEGMIAIQACNGRGMALAAVVGREAAAWAADPTHRTALPLGRPQPIRGYFFARHVPRMVMLAAAAARRLARRNTDH